MVEPCRSLVRGMIRRAASDPGTRDRQRARADYNERRGEGTQKLRPRAARTRPGARHLWVPGFTARVPPHQAVSCGELGDALEERAVFLGRVVDGELRDPVALKGDRDAQP